MLSIEVSNTSKQYELIKANDSKLFTLNFGVNFQAGKCAEFSLSMFTVLCTEYPENLLIQQLLWRMKLMHSSYLITPKQEDNSFTKF